MANLCGVLLLCAAGTLIVLLTLTTPTSGQSLTYSSHYRYVNVRYRRYYYRCRYYYYTYCYRWYYYRWWYYRWYYWRPWYYNPWYGWGYWPYCYRRVSRCCYRYYRYVTYRRRYCQSGWTGSRCNIPVCNPRCKDGRTCVHENNENRCSCLATDGNACTFRACSTDNNCYPGTCVNTVCKCPSGFNGTNCVQINKQPSIGECTVKLSAKPKPDEDERVVAEASCADEELEPDPVWVGEGLNIGETKTDEGPPDKGLTKLEVIWKAEYTDPFPMPDRSRTKFFVKNTPPMIGITEGSYTVQFPGVSVKQGCNGLTRRTPPTATTDQCALPTPWSDLGLDSELKHNKTMTITVSNKLGGEKRGDAAVKYGGFGTQVFTGEEAIKRAKFQFDFKRPTHCLLENDAPNVIDGTANCTVFPISLDEDIRTDPEVYPKFLGWTDDAAGLHRFEVEVYYLRAGTGDTLQQLGDPEVTATVTPDLNNFHYTAPKPGVYAIVVTVYDAANNSARARKIFNYDNEPAYTETDAPAYFKEALNETHPFITKLDNKRKLTLTWPGRFQFNKPKLEWYKRVEPWEIDQRSIDDIYGTTFGLRSISAIDKNEESSNYSCVYIIDPKTGGLGLEVPPDNSSLPQGYIVGNCSVADDTATLNLKSDLRDGNTVVVWVTASDLRGSNTVKRKVTLDESRANVSGHQFLKNREDHFSYIEITVADEETGIDSIQYRIFDRRNQDDVLKGVAAATKRYAEGTRRRKRNTDGIQQPCTANDPTCYCIPLGDCFAYKQEIQIDNCDIDLYKGDNFQLEFVYVVVNLAGKNTDANVIQLGDISDVHCRPNGGLSAGAIAGIIIGLLLLLLLIIIIILILIRIRQNKPAVPQRIRTMANHARKRFTMHSSRTEDNELYVANERPPPAYPGQARPQHQVNLGMDDDMYVDKSDFVVAVIPRKQLQMMDTLGEGRFAVIRRAQLDNGKERRDVAAKALKNGFSKSDEMLMSQKILFMKDVPPHINIVKFIGQVDDTSVEGPIMILEICDQTLKDWLTQRISLTTDDLEAILGFALNIARGVEHLHSSKIIHRRLGVRNVLLQQQVNGLVAKLTGFGPSAEDIDSTSNTTGASTTVPIKWLAPETLDTLSSKKPTYNEKTDAWSYGITVWEMYSKGAAPYEEMRSADVKGQVKRGYRLSCPQDCPPDLYDSVIQPCWHEKSNKRPSFSAICRAIDQFRHSANTETGYYAANETDGHANEIYDDGR